jgi:hypothetical protein
MGELPSIQHPCFDHRPLPTVRAGHDSSRQADRNQCIVTVLHLDRSKITASLPPAPAQSTHQIPSDET